MPKLPFALRAKIFAAELLMAFRDIWFGFRSPHRVVRKASITFALSLVGVGLSIYSFTQYRNDGFHFKDHEPTAQEQAQQQLKEVLEHHQENQKKSSTVVDMGRFVVRLRTITGTRPSEDIYDAAEIGVSLLCNSPDTKMVIESKREKYRDALVSAISQMDRERFLSREGKKHLKRQILKRLNKALPEAHNHDEKLKVENVYFTYLEVH